MNENWKPGSPVPIRYAGMPITFAWNEVALTTMLRALQEGYPSGYVAMVDLVRSAMASYTPPTPPKPEEPTGLGAVVEDVRGLRWTRVESGEAITRNPWYPAGDPDVQPDEWDHIKAVRVLSEGVTL